MIVVDVLYAYVICHLFRRYDQIFEQIWPQITENGIHNAWSYVEVSIPTYVQL